MSKIRLRLKDIENGLISYAEGEFKEEYFSKVSFTMFGQIMHYKFEKFKRPLLSPTSKEIARSKIDTFEKLLIWSKENEMSKNDNPF